MPAHDDLIRTYNDEFITPDEARERAVELEAHYDIAGWEFGEIPSDSGQGGPDRQPNCRMLAPVDGMGFGIPCYGDTQAEADAFARALLGRLGL